VLPGGFGLVVVLVGFGLVGVGLGFVVGDGVGEPPDGDPDAETDGVAAPAPPCAGLAGLLAHVYTPIRMIARPTTAMATV